MWKIKAFQQTSEVRIVGKQMVMERTLLWIWKFWAGIVVRAFSTALAIIFMKGFVCFYVSCPAMPISCYWHPDCGLVLPGCLWTHLHKCSQTHWWPFLFCKNAAIISKSFCWVQNSLKMFLSISLDEMTLSVRPLCGKGHRQNSCGAAEWLCPTSH